ncbi:MAG: DUF4200 domain-containing protein [Planctomycetaceae bacterium]|nr:DUF4200 domain-containing protein [Planctomycetaceae bacterium]
MTTGVPMRNCVLTTFLVLSWGVTMQGGEIGFVEDFALSTDRGTALGQLIPGTEEFYYYTCLHLLNQEQYTKTDEQLKLWVQRHGETSRVWEIRTRRALLSYEQNPQQSIDYLRGRFGIHFPHQKEELRAAPNLPTALDPARISRDAFRQRALQLHQQHLHGFEDAALSWLISEELNADQRRELLSRLQRPDAPNLVQAIADDLAAPKSGGFGSLGIHSQLLLDQLEALLKLRPELLNQQHFVRTYLIRLQPGPDEDWRRDPALTQAYLDRLNAFAERLAPVHNSLKAHVLYHQLVLDRSAGKFDKGLLLKYLALPRNAGYISKAMRESDALRRFPVDLNTNYDGVTLLPGIGNDEPLIRSCLLELLKEAGNSQEYEPLLSDVYLKALFAETKIVNGLGDSEQWAALLSPEQFRQLRERVDLDFDPANPTQFAAAAPVSLSVDIKNVSTLIVKVFEINTENYYRQQGREIDTDINLDGLIANHEQTYQYNDSPLRRIRRKFDFPMLDKAGVYVVDFIGNGQSSRALIRKGHLHHLVRTTAAGQAFMVLDERNQLVSQARLWLSGHEYTADDKGEIHVPFSTNPGRQAVVYTAPAGENGATYSGLGRFEHLGENYQLTVGFHVDRESLLKHKTATVLIRPQLSVNGTPVSITLLEEVQLTIHSSNHEGTPATVTESGFELFEDRETTYEFQVPARLASLQFVLSAQVPQVVTGGKTALSASHAVTLNSIDTTDKLEMLHLIRSAGSYFVELRGHTGEPLRSRPITLELKHREFKEAMPAQLKTDEQGRVALGTLDGIQSLQARGPQDVVSSWRLPENQYTYSQTLHGRVGEELVLPYLGTQAAVSRDEFALLELVSGTYRTDHFNKLSLADGLLRINKLPAGDYRLFLKPQERSIDLRITAGEQLGAFAIGNLRQLETAALQPIQIASVDANDKELTIQLQNISKLTRLHVFATRLVPEFDAFRDLSRVRATEPYRFTYHPAESAYLTGRNIGDEYRYIIDRRYAPRYPGNMLERPSLLLNPWAVTETNTGEVLAAGGGEFGGVGAMPDAAAAKAPGEGEALAREQRGFDNLDFLASASSVLINLTPNEQGRIVIPRAALGPHQELHLVAVDPLNTVSRRISLTEHELLIRDLRLADGLDPGRHFTRRKEIHIVPAGQAFTVHDLATAKLEVYDSLARVHGLYAALTQDAQLAEFAFLLQWPDLEPERKRELYSQYASHELSFFLFKKDPEFFRTVIQPYLKNKQHKTFMDEFLLEDDLTSWLAPWRYGQLNTVERILLARRIDGEHAATARHIADRYALLPRDMDQFNHWFGAAVVSGSLKKSDEFYRQAIDGLQAQNGAVATPALSTWSALGGRAAGKPTEAATKARREMAERQVEQELRLEEMNKLEEKAKRGLSARDGEADARRKQMADEQLGELSDRAALFDGKVSELRANRRQLFRQLDPTWEWAENNYHHLTIGQQNAELITVNGFWKDFAAHDPAQPFLSTSLAEASRNFPEMLLALAVLDLPFKAAEHQSELDGAQLTLTPGGPVVVFHEEVQSAEAPPAASTVLVSQNFFKHGDRHRMENGEQVDKFVTEEFLIHTVYGAQIVITNPTSARQKLNILTQIPQGAIPVLNTLATNTRHLDLEPFHTQTLEYHFYFPAADDFVHFPVQVARNEQLVAAADPFMFHVVNEPTQIDTESWDHISQHGTLAQVTQFLSTHNIDEVNLDRIAWRMHDRAAFDAVLPLLAARHVYSHTLWSYSLLHNAPDAARQYLQHAENIVSECGGRLRSGLVDIDPVLRRSYEHLEYKPLVNARAHTLGARRQIVNDRFHAQYHRFLNQLAYTRELSDEDWLAATYYLLLQDRIEEALAAFAQVDRQQIETAMQYDYCDAYLKFFGDNPEQARAIADKYADHPVDRWRNTFATIGAQLDEAAGKSGDVIDPENRDQQQGALAATEPALDVKVEAGKIDINYQNLTSVKVNFYQVDVELLFSRNPFVQNYGGEFASIKPNHSLQVDLPKNKPTKTIPIPAELRNSNVLVEVTGAGVTRTQPYFSNSMLVQVIENYGQVKVTHAETRKPVSKAYVKVYARTSSGEVKFYKDGYTDLRGRFDYASLSTNDLDTAQRFSILVFSDELGAAVREASPPKR